MTSTAPSADIKKLRNRIKGHRKIRAGDIQLNEGNFREHTDEQRQSLREIYDAVGFARSLLVYEPKPGTFKLIDGECRATETPDEMLDCEVLDVNDAEANVLIAALDPLAAMAKNNLAKQNNLIAEMQQSQKDTIARIMAGAGGMKQEIEQAKAETVLKPLMAAPEMTWILIGLPTTRYDEIAQHVEQMAKLPDILIEKECNAQQPAE